MARKVFLTFLGTGNYLECVYKYNEKKSKVVTYIQTALVDILADDYTDFIAFCTEEASKTHFSKLNEECGGKFKEVIIPQGFDEKEIWDIFKIVFDELEENDEVILDTTHSFRSIPMLGITLIQYAKFIKQITVKGIYYGAFANLGLPKEIVEKYPNPKDRVAPILDLTSFSILQDWTNYGSQFINTGNVNNLSKIADQSTNKILKETQGQDKNAKKLEKINGYLNEIGEDFRTNRGKKYLAAETIIKAKNAIDELKEQTVLSAFTPILTKLNEEFSKYEKDDEKNLLHAVQWCIDKDLIQQGITQLQEAVITILCEKIGEDYMKRKNREIVSSYLTFGIRKPSEEWEGVLKGEKAELLIDKLGEIESLEEISDRYSALTDKRNTINHGGFTDKDAKSSKFKDALSKNYEELKKLL
jgi:CRISPR-associated protein, TM1812 family